MKHPYQVGMLAILIECVAFAVAFLLWAAEPIPFKNAVFLSHVFTWVALGTAAAWVGCDA